MATVVDRPQTAAQYNDLREFIARCQDVDSWRQIDGVDWDLELAAVMEASAERIPEPPLLLFDNVKGYPAGWRVVGLTLGSFRRAAVAYGLDPDLTKLELLRQCARKVQAVQPLAPVEVETGPVMQNRVAGEDVDLFRFPAPRFHIKDGGRYIGTGDLIIQRDPDTGFINVGTYRLSIHEPNLLGIWISPGQDGRRIASRYWEKGESCPVVCSFGGDPNILMSAGTKVPWGRSELDFAGGLRGRPIEYIRGPLTGLPIPAHEEIVIEGEIPPPSEQAHDEGPFGEWPGYYSGGTIGTGEQQPVIRVKAVYYRDEPIICAQPPMWTGAANVAIPISAGVLWDQLEDGGIPDITGVFTFTAYMTVISIRQRYAGHAKQTGLAAVALSAGARNGRYVVVVDDDIDVTNLKEVLWALYTRVDPKTDIELVDRCWSTPLDPRMSPQQRASGDHTNSRAIICAVRPFEWRDKYPVVSRAERDLLNEVVQKYGSILPFQG